MHAIGAVGAIGPDAKGSIPTLIHLLDGEDYRTAAADALVKIGKDSINALLEALKHPKWEVRLGAVNALGQFGADAKKALPALNILWQRDRSQDVQKAARAAYQRINAR